MNTIKPASSKLDKFSNMSKSAGRNCNHHATFHGKPGYVNTTLYHDNRSVPIYYTNIIDNAYAEEDEILGYPYKIDYYPVKKIKPNNDTVTIFYMSSVTVIGLFVLYNIMLAKK